jgi:hypothetical protein
MTDYYQHECKRKLSKAPRLFDTDEECHTSGFEKKKKLEDWI